MNGKTALSSRQLVAAWTVEGLYALPALVLRVVEFLGVWWLTDPTVTFSLTAPPVGMVGISWLLQAALLPPLRLGRLAWYQRLVTAGGVPSLRLLLTGFRRWGGAIRWRWQVWRRRLVAAVIAGLPTALTWGLAHRLTLSEQTTAGLAWAGVGALLLPLAAMGVWLWECRYAPAPLLLLAGCPAGAVMGLSARAMTGHRRQYLNRLSVPLPVPGWRARQVHWLHFRLEKTDLTIFSSTTPVRGCILPPAPL